MTSEPWFAAAECRGMNPDLFFPSHDRGHPQDAANAKAVCAECSVRHECLDYANRERINYGIWGGCTVTERLALRRRGRRLGGAA